jgi:hypothetical protein
MNDSQVWYVARRGELLAQEFLLELGAQYLASLEPADVGFDYMAFFSGKDQGTRVVAVEVKATEREVSPYPN